MAPDIIVLNGSGLRDSELEGITPTVREVFRAEVVIRDCDLDLAGAFDNSRNQTHSTALLGQILSRRVNGPCKQIAIVGIDLFIPILTFVFGEAQLSGRAAIVSSHRLSDQFYGLPRNDALMLKRLEKEIVHELGHTFGLYHCRQFECVMRSSTYVAEIDLKQAKPCSSCSALLAETGGVSFHSSC